MAKMILFQGDSVTDCGRSREIGQQDFPGSGLGAGYPVMVAARMWHDQPERAWKFCNRAISGNRVVDLYARWKMDAVNLRPDILSLLIGVNDTWHEFGAHNGVEVPRAEEFYRRLMDWTIRELPDVRLLLLEPFVLPFGAVGEAWLPEMEQRREFVGRIAKDYAAHAVLVPLQARLNEAQKRTASIVENYWLQDGVHPTPAGHQLIADAWLEAAAPLLK